MADPSVESLLYQYKYIFFFFLLIVVNILSFKYLIIKDEILKSKKKLFL